MRFYDDRIINVYRCGAIIPCYRFGEKFFPVRECFQWNLVVPVTKGA